MRRSIRGPSHGKRTPKHGFNDTHTRRNRGQTGKYLDQDAERLNPQPRPGNDHSGLRPALAQGRATTAVVGHDRSPVGAFARSQKPAPGRARQELICSRGPSPPRGRSTPGRIWNAPKGQPCDAHILPKTMPWAGTSPQLRCGPRPCGPMLKTRSIKFYRRRPRERARECARPVVSTDPGERTCVPRLR
jgi:hypothetical protein